MPFKYTHLLAIRNFWITVSIVFECHIMNEGFEVKGLSGTDDIEVSCGFNEWERLT